jgi:hypothetical protein
VLLVGRRTGWDPPGKVGAVEFGFLFAHRCLLLTHETRLAPVNTLKPSVS